MTQELFENFTNNTFLLNKSPKTNNFNSKIHEYLLCSQIQHEFSQILFNNTLSVLQNARHYCTSSKK